MYLKLNVIEKNLFVFQFLLIIFQQNLFAKEQKRRSENSEPSYPWTFDNDLFGGKIDFNYLLLKKFK